MGVPTPEVTPDDDVEKMIEDKTTKIDLSFEGLKSLVQCSDMELLDGLDEINAIEINNEWRIVDEEYFRGCFQDILLCIMENSINFKKFRTTDIVQNTEEFPPEIINHCIS